MKLTDVFMVILAINSVRGSSLLNMLVIACCTIYAISRIIEKKVQEHDV